MGLANPSDQSAQIMIKPVNSKHLQKKTALFSAIFPMILRLALKLMIARFLGFVSLESKSVVIFTAILCELTLDMFCRLIICQWKIWFKYFLGVTISMEPTVCFDRACNPPFIAKGRISKSFSVTTNNKSIGELVGSPKFENVGQWNGIGAIYFEFVNQTGTGAPVTFALPYDSQIKTYPLVNEIVLLFFLPNQQQGQITANKS